MRIEVLLFAQARERVGKRSLSVSLPSGAAVREVLAAAPLKPLAPLAGGLRFAVNERFSSADTALREGDVVALLPPVGGG